MPDDTIESLKEQIAGLKKAIAAETASKEIWKERYNALEAGEKLKKQATVET